MIHVMNTEITTTMEYNTREFKWPFIAHLSKAKNVRYFLT